jgi:phage terminase large subunit-like protein
LLACVAIDPEGPYGELVDALAEIGITEEGEQIIGVPQGYKLMNAIKTTERKLANGTLRARQKSGLMDWCVGNVKIEPTATAIRATKQNAGDAKIDPWAALMDAATVMVRNPDRLSGNVGLRQDDAAAKVMQSRKPCKSTPTRDEEAAILRDPSHPRWQEMRERFEARLCAAQDTEEFV